MYKNKTRYAQRQTALRVCGAYRTTLTAAVLVVAGLNPKHLLAQERKELFTTKEQVTRLN